MEFLYREYFGNTVLHYLIFLASLLASFLVVRSIGRALIRRLVAWTKKTDSIYGDMLVAGMKHYLLPIAYFSFFYLSTTILSLNATMTRIVGIAATVFAIVFGAVFLSSLAAFFFSRLQRGKEESNKIAVKWMTWIARALIWSIALILFLDNIGVKITSLVTGLGIGGVAIAFAAQSVLTDIFCFFTIFFDKPFEVGDFIVAGEQMGTVEHIGVKTTRLRALNGEQLIFSNADLTGSRISNYKTMRQRRVLFTIGVTYDTPYEKLAELPGLIKSVIEGVEGAAFGRAHFSAYGSYSLNFEIVYYVLSADYDRYMDVNQQINFKIKEAFERRGINFAFPTQSIQFSSPAALPFSTDGKI